ncbi:hypothetical protein PFISCL1PPCAC_24500 [Pristionchus fissidentatus]|uniref:G protein-coupled receptor n=1 Tax=Pristionchus fissidentatus TaxID=1538716 RepID=A0AAV5WRF8_9BILA|nr:hypothetical protein PFISCL1PPCAC_24500 [Pristionchus fissidentatus]
MAARISLLLCGRSSIRSTVLLRLASTSSSSPMKLQSLSSISKEELGPSILWQQSNLPSGSPKTPHDVVALGVKAAKILSLSSSVAGVVMVPVLSSYLWEAAAERPSMMAFAVVANSFLILLSFTPLLLHFLAKRFPMDIHYNSHTQTFSTVHYSFFMRKYVRRFRKEEVVDAAIAPEMKKVWIPLATMFVHGAPLLVSLDRNAYKDPAAFDSLTTNVEIPLNHD